MIDKLIILKNLIEREFREFKSEICKEQGTETFDRAQEIIIKTQIAAEILNDFPATAEFCGRFAELKTIINTLFILSNGRSPKNTPFLDQLYESYLAYQENLFDPETLGDFISSEYDEFNDDEQEYDDYDETRMPY